MTHEAHAGFYREVFTLCQLHAGLSPAEKAALLEFHVVRLRAEAGPVEDVS